MCGGLKKQPAQPGNHDEIGYLPIVGTLLRSPVATPLQEENP
ncbi:hypothetical protein RCH06_001754 [Polaromonas sp. CG_9.5]|nr:hypothetical protein [Polaromonas sp. CG_9.5]